jgi:hypothetical protein
MFAAAKKGKPLGAEFSRKDVVWEVSGRLKKLFEKKPENICGIKKRVLNLHPLSKGTS